MAELNQSGHRKMPLFFFCFLFVTVLYYLIGLGDEFRGQLNVNGEGTPQSEITISAYGDTSLSVPLIKGSEIVEGPWKVYQGDVSFFIFVRIIT